MSQPGFTQQGFYTSKLLFGGLPNGSVIDDHTGTSFSLSSDYLTKNLLVSGQVKTFDSATRTCYKLFCYDTLTLNSSGSIVCDGNSLHGGQHQNENASLGFAWGGSLGGSGTGGNAGIPSVLGQNGSPTAVLKNTYLGGSGGSGGTGAILAGGIGGVTQILDKINKNQFQASLYQNAMLWYNPALEGPGATGFTNWVPSTTTGYVNIPVGGGGGGGGCGDRSQAGGSTGGGACGGGVIYIAADRIIMNGGYLSVMGQSAVSSTGGGGGGGGVVILVCNELVWPSGSTSQIIVSGGVGGGLGATDGATGRVFVFSDQFIGFFEGMVDKETYESAVTLFQMKGRLA
jgi:hypothetical protein